jgi:DNA polymerase III delta subunit
MLTDIVGSASLFGGLEAYLIDTPSEVPEMYAEILSTLAEMAESTNIFIVMEKALLTPEKKKWQKHTSVFEEFTKVAGERFNVFAMAEALSKRDKKSLWILLTEAKQNGLVSEEIIGTLWWQLKALRLAAITNSAKEADMKDYPYNKAKQSLRNFKEGDLDNLSSGLLKVYHDGHGGVRDIELALEEWVLKV